MNNKIQKLDKNQITEIYNQWIVKHFPPDEIKPLSHIYRMLENNTYQGYGMFQEDNTLIGYTFFASVPQQKLLLLDYFAVIEEYRSKGVGADFLKGMKDILKEYQGILIETEDIGSAQNEEERQVRARRDSFYERAGAVKTGIVTKVFGVQYMIWNYNLTEDAKMNVEECRESLTAIYKNMVPGEMYDKNIQI